MVQTGTAIVYLDYNATAPIRPEALAATTTALRTVGNASSAHGPGQEAAYAVDRARAQVATLLGCAANELIFTSGATEANNLAIRSAAGPGCDLVVSAVEHPAVSEAAAEVAAHAGGTVHTIGVYRDGTLRLDELEEALSARPALVSIMAANNETGVLNDLDLVVKLSHEAGTLVHSDATQLVGRLPIDLRKLQLDALSLSGHKFGAPQGVGGLFVRRDTALAIRPLAYGGGHERGQRPGTLNVPGIVGLGAAADAAACHLDQEMVRVRLLRDRFETAVMTALPGTRRNGHPDLRLPGVSSLTFDGLPADAVLAAMPALAASEGSACSSGALEPSRVLLAMGLTRDEADCTIRFSLGYATTTVDIDDAAHHVIDAARRVRAALYPNTTTTASGLAGGQEGQRRHDA
ncbi:cysteine desulfurase [Asanoa hainanensis]|uniref:cysteine desulfurase n=1 Tax=Asanoa hainanensis TaxID=560556 RepID=A0A239IY69_9ACTN|nr:cysteine desulfurase family protein [Asanoa hainanensis]SNS98509.1 cysteine desulfurase [Asanoa hainanensis]